MHLYLTNRCNLCCPHCYMFSGKANEKELTTEEIIQLITDYRNVAHGSCITLSGGEPALHNDFDFIVQKAAEMGLDVKILTNGTLMSRERIKRLSQYIYSVQISIDGFSEETNSLIRGKGVFNKALSSIDVFLEYGVNTSIAITPSIDMLRTYQDEYIAFAKYLSKKYKDRPLKINFAEELIHGREINPSKGANKEYYDLMCNIQKQIYGEDFEIVNFVSTLRNNVILDNCMFGNFAVASNGDVFYCARIEDLYPIANIRTSTVKDIYEKSLQAEKVTLVSNLEPCNKCELRYICGGGCRIEEFPEVNKITSFDDYDICKCKISRKECCQDLKNKFYDLMIHSNKYLYSPLE